MVEIFNASAYSYIEMEGHGPAVSLEPGESSTLNLNSALIDLDAVPAAPVFICKGLGLDFGEEPGSGAPAWTVTENE